MKLSIQICESHLVPFYMKKYNHLTDSGFDLYPNIQENFLIPAKSIGYKIPLGIKCAPQDDSGYYLYPRSSIVKTPLRLVNSVGIIDMTYRGEIMAVVDNISNEDFVLKPGMSLFQLCAPDLKPLQVEFTAGLPSSQRGEGGFGSTH